MSNLTIVDLPQADELSPAGMDEVAGGISCKAGTAVAQVDMLTGDILKALGNNIGAAAFYGKGIGVLQGSCPA
jgi:hypothetical protein